MSNRSSGRRRGSASSRSPSDETPLPQSALAAAGAVAAPGLPCSTGATLCTVRPVRAQQLCPDPRLRRARTSCEDQPAHTPQRAGHSSPSDSSGFRRFRGRRDAVVPRSMLPSWSPDSKRIVFVSERIGKRQRRLFVVNANGPGGSDAEPWRHGHVARLDPRLRERRAGSSSPQNTAGPTNHFR